MARYLEIGLSNAVMAGLLAVLAAALCRVYRRPAFAHGLWLVVLLKLLTPPLVLVPLPWFGARDAQPPMELSLLLEPAPQRAESILPSEAATALLQVKEINLSALDVQCTPDSSQAMSRLHTGYWHGPILVVWLTGSAVALLWFIRSMRQFKKVLRLAGKAGGDLQDQVKELAGRLKLRRHPEVWLLPGTFSPMLWTLDRRPRLLLPAELLERLDREQLQTILLHELAHWRRRDHWVRFLELAVTVCYWWHPAVWWARRELREAEEQCCDAWVTCVLEGSDRTYALALLETVAFLSKARMPLPASASGIGQATQLRRRLTMIMNGQKRGPLTWVGCAGLLTFAALLLPFISVRAQAPEKKDAKGAIFVDCDGDGFIDILLADDGAPDQEAIELLKRALKLLADKKQAKAGAAPKQAQVDEINQARRQVESLTREVDSLHDQIRLRESMLRQAQARLAALQGGAGAKQGVPLQIQLKVEPDKSLEKAKNPAQSLKDGKAVGALWPRKAPAQPEDLKARLDRLVREVEELRKEMKQTPAPK